MGLTRTRWGTRQLVAGVLGAACVASTWGALAPPAAHARGSVVMGDDYPWAWQGKCPIMPQEPIVEPSPTPTPTTTPVPGEPEPSVGLTPPPPPPPEPVFDPVSGHFYDPRGPRPHCERRVWELAGSIGDSWGFALRNCTSFVAWRLTRTNGLTSFTNDDRGEHWGDARDWDDTARALGYRVDDVPAIGAVAQSDEGRVGHVAWVVDIGPGTVTIEEYNHAVPGGYGVRTVPVESFRYLHLRDLAPSPFIGSDRPLVSVADGGGESWTARIDASGTLRVAQPRRPARVVGPRGAFSPLAAAALTLDHRGRPWTAATTRDGKVLAGTPGRRQWRLRAVGTAAPTSSPALVPTPAGRLALYAISGDGTLTSRELSRHGRWLRVRPVGRRGSWATATAPVTGTDSTGRAWVVAVTERGRAFARRTTAKGWSALTPLRGTGSSITSTPSLTLDRSGVLHVHQTSEAGVISVRSLVGGTWSRPSTLEGSWSPYSSAAVLEIGGELQMAAVTADGTVRVRPALPGASSTLRQISPRAGHPTASPGLVTRSNSGVFVVSTHGKRQLTTLVLRPADAVTGRTGPTRAGIMP